MSDAPKASDCWLTPPPFVNVAEAIWPEGIGVDPFGHERQVMPAAFVRTLASGWDALAGTVGEAADRWADQIPEGGPASFWVNGPYSGRNPARTAAIVARLHLRHPEILNLTPCSPGSNYWAQHVWPWASCVAWCGRPAFVAGEDMTAEKDGQTVVVHKAGKLAKGNRTEMALIYMGRRRQVFRAACAHEGWTVTG